MVIVDNNIQQLQVDTLNKQFLSLHRIKVMHLLMKQKMVRGVVAKLLSLIDETPVVSDDIVTVLDELLK